MNSMILTTPSKIGASVKLQFIICIWTLKNQIWKTNSAVCIDHATPCWPFPWKFKVLKKGRDTNFLLAIFGIFSHKNCSSWKLSLVSKLFQFLGKIRWKRREFISDQVSILTQIRIFCYCCLQNVRKNVRMNSWKPLKR